MFGAESLPYPVFLVVDPDEPRGQRLARLLTLANCRVVLTNSPVMAFGRYLQEPFDARAILLGAVEDQGGSVLNRLTQRMSQQFGRMAPTIPIPAAIPESPPLAAIERSPFVATTAHSLARECLPILEQAWALAPEARPRLETNEYALTLTLLPGQGVPGRISTLRRSRNSHFRQALAPAREVIGPDRWEAAIMDVGLGALRDPRHWPEDSDERAIPPEYLTLLHQAVALSSDDIPTARLRRWSDLLTQVSLREHTPSAVTQQALKLLPREQVMNATLKAYTNEMNEVRGEPLHEWVHRPDGCYWIAQYSNLYTYGRLRTERPECHVWLASLEAILRQVHLDETWEAVEMECTCQTQTGHCLFMVRPRASASAQRGRVTHKFTDG
jgi:hypothetical protein